MEMPQIHPGETPDSFIARLLKDEEVVKNWPDEGSRVQACLSHVRKSMGAKGKNRRLRKVFPQFISLVPRGANKLPVIYKSDEETAEFNMAIAKSMNDEGELLAVVYSPDQRDAHGDIADAEVVKEMAHSYHKDGGQIDLRHNGKAIAPEDAFVAESFIVQKGDSRFDNITDYEGNPVGDLTGSWAVLIKVENEELRNLYRSGDWAGVSLSGPALVEYTEKAAREPKSKRLLTELAEHLGLSRSSAFQSITLTGEIDMTSEELQKALEESNKTLIEGVSKSLTNTLEQAGLVKSDENGNIVKADLSKSEETTETPKKDKSTQVQEPVFKGDITDPEDVQTFEYQRKRYDIEKEMDPSDADSVAGAAEELAELNKEYPEEIVKKAQTASPARGRRRAAPSNAPKDDQPDTTATVGVSKEDMTLIEKGRTMAAGINKSRGYDG